ncbi:hypothetical protein GGR51DRAFT_333263 [Nemania sp. FL0031]|nr:hypothetical protein GGR51DRAFT_333263 [Nemania sp. FL0031]
MSTPQCSDKAREEIEKGVLIIKRILDKVRDSPLASEYLRQLQGYHRQLRELIQHPNAEVKVPAIAPIQLFLRALHSKSLITGANYKTHLRDLTEGLMMKSDRKVPYAPGLPKAIHCDFTKNMRLVIGTSADIWHYNEGLQAKSRDVRKTRLNKLKSQCDQEFRRRFESFSKTLEEDFKTLQAQGNRRSSFTKAAAAWRERLQGFGLTGETIKPTGEPKPPRYIYYSRFPRVAPGTQDSVRQAFEIESCAEVEAMYAIQAEASSAALKDTAEGEEGKV